MKNGFEDMLNLVGKGKRIWKQIYNLPLKDALYYVIPEENKDVLINVERHIREYGKNKKNIVIYADKVKLAKIGQVKYIKLSVQQMEYLLLYLRSCRDAMLNINLENVFVLSFKEVGGESLQRLYEENIYEEDFMIKQWLLPNPYECNKWRS